MMHLPATLSVDLPVVHLILAKVQLNGVQAHCGSNIHPAPQVAACVAPSESPADAVAVRRRDREVLQKQACVDGDQDGWREPRQEAHELVRGVGGVVQIGGLVHQCPGTRLPHSRYDPRGAVEDNDSVGERDDDAWRDGLEGGPQEGQGGADGVGELSKHMEEC